MQKFNKSIPIVEKKAIETLPIPADTSSESKDWVMARSMATLAKPRPQKNLTTVDISYVNRDTKVVFVLLPEWGTYFPPYNLARLISVVRAAGFWTKAFDINIETYNALKEKSKINFWDSSNEWMWDKGVYWQYVHDHVKEIYEHYIEEIVSLNPDVVGFTLYYTNEEGSNWMAEKIRQRLPNVKIIAGGPQAIAPTPHLTNNYDHFIAGEGEKLIIELLEKIDSKAPITEKRFSNPVGTRLDLDQLPFPDYSDFDFSLYTVPNGISAEISRGCVAKCVFCTEVHFWKYRGRMSGNILDEIEYQNKQHQVDVVWFIDSLVNGNLKELRAFSLGVVERGLKIQWQGYARCDGRMDDDYYRDLAKSGCFYLNYGVESGSQRVLDDMKKAVTREEIEANFKSGKKTGIKGSTNWILGFPSETIQDVADTFTIVWRIKENNLFNISPGVSMMLSPGSEVLDNKSKFNISDKEFMQSWTTNDLKNTKVHRMIRQKSFLIFIQNLYTKEYVWGVDRDNLKKCYTLECDPANADLDIPYEEFDYNIINSDRGEFANSVMNEVWPLFRTLWRSIGPYKMSITYEPTFDMHELGHRLACDLNAVLSFNIDPEGNWDADFDFKFNQTSEQSWVSYAWPDYSFEYSYKDTGSWVRDC